MSNRSRELNVEESFFLACLRTISGPVSWQWATG
nr:MAG TPA: Marek's disease-like virus SORF3 protein [Caudoviricetes sp.]